MFKIISVMPHTKLLQRQLFFINCIIIILLNYSLIVILSVIIINIII